ncbi:MAG: B12-binding domain-containing radical SAM protein [Syntrophobacterales bacterium]|nr:MAG: B12-binding domain-containing radical SAM protein [Syntrophobacterales bacterium]
MKYEGMIIRPPSEAGSLLLQVTVGCSHNKCTFCPTYKGERFRIKSFEEIEEDILEASRYAAVPRVFICDGDALIIPQNKLLPIIESIKHNIKGVERIGTYANTKSILRKTPEELSQLRELGLSIAYLGVETGNEELLKKINKGATYEQLVEAGRKIMDAGITLSVTVLLGIGGREKSKAHAIDTARILTDIDPDYVGALTVMVVPGTELYEEQMSGRFELPDTFGFLEELRLMIERSDFTDCFFTANHASNYLPITARMPGEKDKTLEMIKRVIDSRDRGRLKPEYLRGL